METIREFVEREGIELRAEPFTMRPDDLMSTMKRHFKCTLRKRRDTLENERCAACGQHTDPRAYQGYANAKHAPENGYPRASVQCDGQWEKMGPYLTIWFSQGDAWKVPPTVEDVLDSLAMDASGYDNARNFADWCAEYGYDDDSRTAERIYHACGELAKELRHMLGSEAYERLLFEVERL